MHSALYTGSLRHRRFAPREHEFEYELAMAWIDLAELDHVFRGRWLWSAKRPALAWLKRSDYLGDPAKPLDGEVRDLVERETGVRPRGPVRLLTHLRTFGYCFNPVSFYYCYDEKDARVVAIVAEITNTPWKERHAYVLPARDTVSRGPALRFRFDKRFHVSPFMPMEMGYDWRFGRPGPTLAVHMENLSGGAKVFDATLSLERREISTATLAFALLRFPFATLRVSFAIHWQALRLWAKRIPFHDHPGHDAARTP